MGEGSVFTEEIPNVHLIPQLGFLEQRLGGVHSLLRGWVGEVELIDDLAGRLERDVARMSDSAFARSFRARCSVEGVETSDYLHRVVSLRDGRNVLAGIRFRALDVETPFVEIIASTFPIDSPSVLTEVRAEVQRAFAMFAPVWMRLLFAEPPASALAPFDWSPDLAVLAAPLATLARCERPPQSDVLQLRPADLPVAEERVRAAYQSLLDDSPAMMGRMRPASLEDLEACADAGHLYDAFAGSSWAGLIGACPRDDYGMRGLCVVEEILDGPFRGRGLGPVLQRLLIDRLPSDGRKILWGSIDAANEPSLATARRVGRVEIARHVFVSLR